MKRLTDPDALLLQGAADPTRLAILRQLAAGDGVCACDFTACCEVAQPTVSHHLKVLRETGWVPIGASRARYVRTTACGRKPWSASGRSQVNSPRLPRGSGPGPCR